MVVDELIDRALCIAEDKKIKDVRAGLGYTCVVLEDDSCGLAYTFRGQLGPCCGVLPTAGSLIGSYAREIIGWIKEGNRLKAAIGLATMNALMNDPSKNWDKGNVLTAFDLQASESFGMVGKFDPILKNIRTMTKDIYVFEQNPAEDSGLYPSEEIPLYLPKCDVVVLTATSLINHTFDEIAPYCKNAKEVCLVGPSTTLCPEVFKKYNITLLAGSVVKNPELILQIVSQGGGTMSMKPAIEQVLVRT